MNRTKILLVAVLATNILITIAQSGTQIDLAQFNYELIQQLYKNKINSYRNKKGLQPLNNNNVLQLAATDQAIYCAKIKRLSHEQTDNQLKYSPADRVKFYKGNFYFCGENLLQTFINTPFFDKKTNANKTITTYEALADEFFEIWKNSPPHHQNMINPTYTTSALGISIKNNFIYAAEVFGSNPYYPPKNTLHYTDSTFSIKEYDEVKCKKLLAGLDFLALSMANFITEEDGKIYQYYLYQDKIKSLLTNKNDGLAIDIVFEKQITCDKINLHPSTVFDGYFLQPKYRDELLQNDILETTDFMSYLGDVPPGIKDYQLNLIIIKDNIACSYSYPVDIPNEILSTVKIDPFWVRKNGKIKSDTAVYTKEFYIPFAQNESKKSAFDYDRLRQLIKTYDIGIKDISVEAFSSIEGNENINQNLQKKRAGDIEAIIKQNMKSIYPIKIQTKENWELFEKQLQKNDYVKFFEGKTKNEIRKYINENYILFEKDMEAQRVAKVTLQISKAFSDNILTEELPFVIDYSFLKKDTQQAMIAFSRLITGFEDSLISPLVFTNIEVPDTLSNTVIINNYFASLLVQSYDMHELYFDERQISFVQSILEKSYKDYPPLLANKVNYFTLCYASGILQNTSFFGEIKNDIAKLETTTDKNIDKQLVAKLYYNYYLTGSLFYYYVKEFNKMFDCYYKVKDMVLKTNLSLSEIIDDALYFNSFRDFSTTIPLLESGLSKYPNNKELVMLYVTTGAFYNTQTNYHLDYYYNQIEKWNKIDHKALCDWKKINFQLLRDDKLHELLCKFCN